MLNLIHSVSRPLHRSRSMLQRAHLRRACLVLIEVEVDDVANLLPAPVHHPVMPVEGPLPSHQALQARQWAAHTALLHAQDP